MPLSCVFGKNFLKYILLEGPHDNMDQGKKKKNSPFDLEIRLLQFLLHKQPDKCAKMAAQRFVLQHLLQ